MSMYNYGIGGNEVKQDITEGIADIPINRTMFVQKLTDDPPAVPELVQGLRNIKEVFDHYQPKVPIELYNLDGEVKDETLNFRTVADFTKNGIINQSDYLKEVSENIETYNKLAKQLKSNKVFLKMLSDPQARKAYIDSLKDMINELENV
jgi:hypothetical protein